MYDEMRVRATSNRPIRTFGGREYYCEPPKYKEGKVLTYDYKMVNLLIQGSAADCTKESLIRYHANKNHAAKIVLNVHDQITVSVPKNIIHREMQVLRESMESIEFDVKMLTEGSLSATNWDELTDYDKKGTIICKGVV
jgi:DNA polymerase-1